MSLKKANPIHSPGGASRSSVASIILDKGNITGFREFRLDAIGNYSPSSATFELMQFAFHATARENSRTIDLLKEINTTGYY